MRPESLELVEELIFGRDFCRKTVAIGRPKNGVSEGIDRYNARYACDMQKLHFRFLPSGHLVGESPIPRFEKNGVFLWLLLIVVAADTAFPFWGNLSR